MAVAGAGSALAVDLNADLSSSNGQQTTINLGNVVGGDPGLVANTLYVNSFGGGPNAYTAIGFKKDTAPSWVDSVASGVITSPSATNSYSAHTPSAIGLLFPCDLNDGLAYSGVVQYMEDTSTTTTLGGGTGPGIVVTGAAVTISFTVTSLGSNCSSLDILGFYAPVDMGILNYAKAGSTIPLKFEIFDGATEVTDTGEVTSFTQKIVCEAGAGDAIETYSTGETSLRYDWTSGQFVFNWKTAKSWAGSCYRVTLSVDGDSIYADFQLR